MKHNFFFFNYESILFKQLKGIILTLLVSCLTYVSAQTQVTISGATGSINTSYATLGAAFTAINGNASGLATDNIVIQISGNTSETAAPTTLNAPKGVSSITTTGGATTYKFPVITLTGGTNTATGTFVVTIYNGKIQSIVNTGGAWSVVPTVTIEGVGGPSNLNVTTQATAFCTGTNLTFNITDGGAGYGPKTTVTPTGSGSGAAIGYVLTSASTTPGGSAGNYTISPTSVAVAGSYLDYAGSGYTGGATSPATNTTGGTFASGSAATASTGFGIASGNYASILIYPTASNLTISASSSVNQPFLVLLGASNVTIDGRVYTAGVPSGQADLTIQYVTTNGSTNNASTIYLNAGAHHNTIKYCKIKSVTQNGNTRGTLAIGTYSIASSAVNSCVGGSNNTISNNVFSAYYTGSETYKGNGALITSACFNDDLPNSNNVFDSNTFDNYFINGPTTQISGAIYLFGNTNPNKPTNVNCTITNNSFFQSTNGATTANAGRVFIKLGGTNSYAGYGHTISGNYMGGKAVGCTGGVMTKTGAFQDNLTGIYLNASYGAATTISTNVMKNISFTNGGGAVSNTTRFLDINGYGPVTITNNTMGDNASGSIIIDNSAITNPSNFQSIYLNTAGDVTCSNNSIGSISISNNSLTNFGGIWKSATAGNCTISNNTIGNASTASSILNNSGSTQYVYPIYNAGTGSINVSSNTIANITNNSTTGSLYGIYMSGVGTTSVNGNIIYSNVITGYTGTGSLIGIQSSQGINTITNNIVRLGDDNACHIRGISDNTTTSVGAKIYHNTVYLSGAPTSGAFTSACIHNTYDAAQTAKDYRNNILVNARSNSGSASGEHYAFYITSNTATGLTINGNNYYTTGTGGYALKIGTGNATNTLPSFSGQDVNSISVNPSFANAGGITPDSYVPYSSSITGVDLSATVTADYNALSRSTTPTMGAIDFATWNGSVWNIAPTSNYNAKINGTFSGAGFACRNLVLNVGKQLSITSGTLAVANNFTILSDAANGTGTFINTGSLTVGGTSTVQQYLADTRNWYISSPVSGAIAPTGYAYYQRDETFNSGVGSWTSRPFVNDSIFLRGHGYIALPNAAASTIQFTGTLNNGNINTTLTKSGTGYNLIGNPYPCHLGWTYNFANANSALIESSIWVRTTTGTTNSNGTWSFATFNATSSESVPSVANVGIIPPMQAFWVKAKTTGTLTLDGNLTKSHQSSNPLKAPALRHIDRQRVRLEVSNGLRTDETLLFFDTNAENGYDRYDSPKFAESNSEVQIYTSVGNEKLVMNGMKELPLNQEIVLGFIQGSSSSFSIKANEMSNLPSNVKVILKDYANNGLEFDLTDGLSTYTFNPTSNNNESRFSLLFRVPGVTTEMDNATKINTQVFINAANQITIIAPVKSNYAIFNAMGQQVTNGVTTSNYQTANTKLAAGMYIVKVGNQSTRVIAP